MVVEHDGGSGYRSDYEPDFDNALDNALEGITADLDGLARYGLRMQGLLAGAPKSIMSHLMEMAEPVQGGLRGGMTERDPYLGPISPFPEGLQAAQVLTRRLSDFGSFMADVNQGLENIGNAAIVVAEIYRKADDENSAGLSDVSFAFGDRGAPPPSGFREHETLAELRRQDDGQPLLPMAMLGDDSRATRYPIDDGGTGTGYGYMYIYPDGSMKTVWHTTRSTGSPYDSEMTVVETTIYAPDKATVLQTTTEQRYTDDNGQRVHEKTVTSSVDEDNQTTTATTATEHRDGSVTVRERTSTTTGDETEHTSSKTTKAPGEHRPEPANEPGPVEEFVERFSDEQEVRDLGFGHLGNARPGVEVPSS